MSKPPSRRVPSVDPGLLPGCCCRTAQCRRLLLLYGRRGRGRGRGCFGRPRLLQPARLLNSLLLDKPDLLGHGRRCRFF